MRKVLHRKSNLILRTTDELVSNAQLGGPNTKSSRLFTSVLEADFTAAMVHRKQNLQYYTKENNFGGLTLYF